jgi:hypothetical protein
MKSCEDRLSLLDFSDEYSFNNKKNRQYNNFLSSARSEDSRKQDGEPLRLEKLRGFLLVQVGSNRFLAVFVG